jgi:hypothetical protein
MGPKAFPFERLMAIFYKIVVDIDGYEKLSLVDVQMLVSPTFLSLFLAAFFFLT